jgi:SAM-dependent methyltransferase
MKSQMHAPSSSDWAGTRGEKWLAQLALTEATFRPVDAPLIDALRLESPCRIADVACGGGGTSQELLRRAPEGSRVDGFDVSPALVEAARARLPSGARAIRFELADVARVVPPEPYARMVSRFGTMFFDDPQAAFSNLARWLLPGGRFAFAVWGRLEDNAWMTTVRELVSEYVEVPPVGGDVPGPFRYASVDPLLALLEKAGFVRLEVSTWRGAVPIGGGVTAAEAARFALTAFSTFGELLTAAGKLEDARVALTEKLARHEEGGAVRLGAAVQLVSGGR